MSMDNRTLSDKLLRELQELALLSDDQIDTVDIPEVTDWSNGKRGSFASDKIENRNYDVRAIANWFLDNLAKVGIGVTNLSLNKLVYFAVERALIERSVLLTPAKIEAWNHGPVFREIYHAFKSNSDRTITEHISRYSIPQRKMIKASEDFLVDDVAMLKHIAQTYGNLTASRLRNISHEQGGAWDTTWNYKGRVNPGMEITPATIFMRAPSKRDING